MKLKSFDLIVIGGGPGGYPAAIRAAQRGLKVALVEKNRLGGTCLQRGCIPSKGYIAAAEMIQMVARAERIGVHFSEPQIDYQKLVETKDQKVSKLTQGIGSLLKGNGVELIEGEASLESPTSVRVNDQVYQAKNILLATGSEPVKPSSFPFDGTAILTTDEIFALKERPKRLMVVGGGVIGCELACAYNLLGSEVTLVEFLPEILSTEGGLASRSLKSLFEKRGIKVLTGIKVEEMEKDDCVYSSLSNGEVEKADIVLVAIGRRVGEDKIGLGKLGVILEKGFIKVDSRMRTSVPSIYAVGDLTGKTMLAHGATAEGICAAENIAGHSMEIDYLSIPRIAYTIPEVASVGWNERQLKEGKRSYKTGRFSYLANGMAMLHEETEGFAEVYVSDDRKILGATAFGTQASTLIQEVAIIMKNKLSVDALVETIHAHPTITEIIHEAAEDSVGLAIHKAGRRSN
ncbi:MAG: dihydrolipoyl dehydrogenase [Deltaproteobacteria bacterium]|nr:dihydrolipoyl dehydrogenase [Deltaproteobacteria bacterium]